jgi:chromate transporter
VASRRDLAWTFFLIGLTSWGGPAIVAQIREVVVRRKGWTTDEEFQDSVAFANMIPGAVAVQTAAHVGWRLHGGLGAFLALTAYVTPAIVLMIALSAIYFRLGQLAITHVVLRGMRAATVAIVVGSLLSLGATTLRSWRGVAIALGAAGALLAQQSMLLVLGGAALLGVLVLPREAAGAPASPEPAAPHRRAFGKTLAWASGILLGFVALVAALSLVAPRSLHLAWVMVKVNLLAFGGGYTAVALMYHQVVADHGWLTPTEFLDGLALGQVTPGPVIVTATFIGYRLGGVPAALFATLCVFLPSAVLLVVLAPQFARLRRIHVVGSLVQGLLSAFIGMLFFVLWQVAKAAIVDPLTLGLTVASVAALWLRTNPAWIVLGAVVVVLALGR